MLYNELYKSANFAIPNFVVVFSAHNTTNHNILFGQDERIIMFVFPAIINAVTFFFLLTPPFLFFVRCCICMLLDTWLRHGCFGFFFLKM